LSQVKELDDGQR